MNAYVVAHHLRVTALVEQGQRRRKERKTLKYNILGKHHLNSSTRHIDNKGESNSLQSKYHIKLILL